MILVFVVLPLVIFTALALLPRGRPALIGLGVAAAVNFAAWLATPDGEAGAYGRILLTMSAIGIVMAAMAQALRTALPADPPRWAYPLVMAGVLALSLAAGRLAI